MSDAGHKGSPNRAVKTQKRTSRAASESHKNKRVSLFEGEAEVVVD